MQLLDQVKQEDGSYIVRIWRDEVAPDAIDSYNWVKLPDNATASQKTAYEANMVDQAKALSALQIPATIDPTVITQNTTAISDQAAAVEALTPDDSSNTNTSTVQSGQ